MDRHKKFDVEIVRTIAVERLSWPERGAAADESCLGCNRSYTDLRRLSWSEARRVFELEEAFIARVLASSDPDAECDVIDEEQYDDPLGGIYGLDIGVASSVIALSAARCIPFSSCNGGAFGGHHNEVYPVVAFYARPEAAGLLLECAAKAGIGIDSGDGGCLVAYAQDVPGFRRFAAALVERSHDFRALRIPHSRKEELERPVQGRQLNLL